MENYVCIHGHFYQPPRENAWLEAIEIQDSAFPYHDWNERITAECYAPNGSARILTDDGQIEQIVNNYAHLSFNFGPTLLSWLETNEPHVYAQIIAADRESITRFGGHGSAMAQVYNHIIMPLANARDQRTQVAWGLADFERRFGRKPEGMWLAETAADIASLEALAEQGIIFTVLAPRQAASIRPLSGKKSSWEDVSGERIDPTRAYLCKLPSGRSINIFFYDGPISRAVAFEGLLHRGETFAGRLLSALNPARTWPQLIHIATDGETFGHHHRYGEMALAFALHYIETNQLAKVINYGQFLELFPPTFEVQVIENSSWSCVHGVDRWRVDCGCCSGSNPSWNQAWRAPLREALDWLRDEIAPLYEQGLKGALKDPWTARDAYIACVLNRDPAVRDNFFKQHAARALTSEERVRVVKQMEMQRNALLMYTSCGWFFDDLAGIETVQILQYAARAIQLANQVFGKNFEPEFVTLLEQGSSNQRAHGSGRSIWEKQVSPSIVSLERVAASFATIEMFSATPREDQFYCYAVRHSDIERFESGRSRLTVGRIQVRSSITGDFGAFFYGVLHLGDQNISAGVIADTDEGKFANFVEQLSEPLLRADLPQTIRVMDKCFGDTMISIGSLFHDEQMKILNQALSTSLAEAEAAYQTIYENNAPLMRFLGGLNIPLPRPFVTSAEFALNAQLRRALSSEELDSDLIRQILREVKMEKVKLDHAEQELTLRQTIEQIATEWHERPESIERLTRLERALALCSRLPFEINNWKAQNIFYSLCSTTARERSAKAAEGDGKAQAWMTLYAKLAVELKMGAFLNSQPKV